MNPLDPSFWADEFRALFSILLTYVRSALGLGVRAGFEALDTTGSIAQDQFDAFVSQYALSTAATITETSRRHAIDAISQWAGTGKPLDDLVDALTPMFGANRARMIAVTETTRAVAEGNLAAWRQEEVWGKRWMTVQDDRVCPICAPLDGMIVELESNGFTTEIGDIGLTAPDAHIGCRCYLQPVLVQPGLDDA